MAVSFCAYFFSWGVDDKLIFLTTTCDVHFLFADRRDVQLLIIGLLYASCYVRVRMANVLQSTSWQIVLPF